MQPETPDLAADPALLDEGATPVDLEHFAAVSAEIEAGAARGEVLARECLSVDAWTRAQESWLGKMAEEAARKRFEVTNRYNAAFIARRRALEAAARRGGKKGAPAKIPALASPIAAPPPIVALPSSVAALPVSALPSSVALPPVVASVPNSDAPSLTPLPVFTPSPSFPVAAVVAPPSFAAPLAVASPEPMRLGGTIAAEVISPFAASPSLPFQPGPPVLADSHDAPKPRGKRSGTLTDAAVPLTTKDMPFVAGGDARPVTKPPSSQPPPQGDSVLPFTKRAAAAGGESGAALPFTKRAAASVAVSNSALPFTKKAAPFVDVSDSALPFAKQATPFVAGGDSALPFTKPATPFVAGGDSALPFTKPATPFVAGSDSALPFTKQATPFVAESDSALPFTRNTTPAAAEAEVRASVEPPPSRPAPHVAPAPPPSQPDAKQTVPPGTVSPFATIDALPFRATSSFASPAPKGAASLKNMPFRAASPVPAAPDSAPVSTPAPSSTPAPASTPSPVLAPPVAAWGTRFTLEQFASLAAEIAVAPAAVAQVRGRYGLDEASHRAESDEWARRFAADKELFARYGALFQSYRDWLARSGR